MNRNFAILWGSAFLLLVLVALSYTGNGTILEGVPVAVSIGIGIAGIGVLLASTILAIRRNAG